MGDWRAHKKVEGGGTSAAPCKTGELGQELIKHFEGCRLQAYPDPASGGDPWTIGFGHTGPEVVPGYTITQPVANQLLCDDLDRFEKAVLQNIDVAIDQCEFDALVSFTYNCGAGALAESTLRRRLNSGENKPTVFAEELPRWTNGGMAGLVRRRNAEVKLANQKQFP